MKHPNGHADQMQRSLFFLNEAMCVFSGQNFVVLRRATIKVQGNHVSRLGAG
jgi:hypothetical protein